MRDRESESEETRGRTPAAGGGCCCCATAEPDGTMLADDEAIEEASSPPLPDMPCDVNEEGSIRNNTTATSR